MDACHACLGGAAGQKPSAHPRKSRSHLGNAPFQVPDAKTFFYTLAAVPATKSAPRHDAVTVEPASIQSDSTTSAGVFRRHSSGTKDTSAAPTITTQPRSIVCSTPATPRPQHRPLSMSSTTTTRPKFIRKDDDDDEDEDDETAQWLSIHERRRWRIRSSSKIQGKELIQF